MTPPPQPHPAGPEPVGQNAAPASGGPTEGLNAPARSGEVSQSVSGASQSTLDGAHSCSEQAAGRVDRESPSTPTDDRTGGEWTPAFPGQRPPFAPGHELSVQHGAFSPRKVDPLATELVQRLLGDDALGYLKAGAYRPALWAWARAEARVQLLEEYIGDQVGDLSDGRVQSAYSYLVKFQGRAESGRKQLGLDPLSRARLGKDVAQGQAADAATALTKAREQAERRAQTEGT